MQLTGQAKTHEPSLILIQGSQITCVNNFLPFSEIGEFISLHGQIQQFDPFHPCFLL